MKETKTLNDLKINYENLDVIRCDELRQEVIKWVKEDFSLIDSNRAYPKAIVKQWMWRFNLKEKDLNDDFCVEDEV